MDGLLLIDKPEGWTSHDVVAKVRGILNNAQKQKPWRRVKVGHTGTLDPMATGLLVLVIGSYTKQAGEFSKLDKVYQAELTLGAMSTTGDKEGEITSRPQTVDSRPGQTAIEAVLGQFKGKILQKPHKYSAVKINGQRAYKAARAGKTVELEPREVTIYEITDVSYEYPTLKFTTKVSSGTYIRSLAEDIGEELGTGAYLTSLRRSQVGRLSIQDALKMAGLSAQDIERSLQK